ncbi:hypothetical protein V1512DRAFT_286818 [Lipomyces arxii]|uniref:uncharacterized protein n=1 Tax=Lipomyces arxii TaxID=56418 RepID=UPI0034CF98D0
MSGAIRKTGSIRKILMISSVIVFLVLILSSIKTTAPTYTRIPNSTSASTGTEKVNTKNADNTKINQAEKVEEPVTPAEPEVPLVNGKPFNMTFLIPLTSTHFNFCRSLYTALINDYPKPTLINWGKTYQTAPEARVHKINGLNDYLHKLDPNDYVLIMDGFDVWYQLPYRDLVQHYVEMTEQNSHSVAVFGADKKCWPNAPESPACINIPHSTLPKDAYGPFTDRGSAVAKSRAVFPYNRPRWLNSGNILGPASVLQTVYDRANFSISHANPEDIFSDQLYIADVFGQQDLPMVIDYKSDLFQTMTFSHSDVIFVDDDVMSSPRKAPSDRRKLAFNKISGVLPPVLHFNGPKNAMDEWWPKMWWHQERKKPELIEKTKKVFEEGGAYTAEGEFVSWTELCGTNIDFNVVPKGITHYS